MTTTWELLTGWLKNLAPTMRAKQIIHHVDELHQSGSAEGRKKGGAWWCPLLRLSFWTQVTNDFSPLAPSPGRSASIFGSTARNMIHGTLLHPTQLFDTLYNKLADVSTSKGFCYCVDWEDCQVQSVSSTGTSSCSLIKTMRSMYDAKWRTTALLTQNNNVCTQQLDWPFVGGMMRKGLWHTSGTGLRSSPQRLPREHATCWTGCHRSSTGAHVFLHCIISHFSCNTFNASMQVQGIRQDSEGCCRQDQPE
jgi:hypothetical protein